MRAFIEDRNGIKYEFKRLSRKQKISLSKKLQQAENDFEKIDEMFTELFIMNYADKTPEFVSDVLDYNEEIYGLEQTYELVSLIIQEVFTQVGTETRQHPYLQMKKEA